MKTFEQYLNEGQHFLHSIGKNDTVVNTIDEICNILKQNKRLPVVFTCNGTYYETSCYGFNKSISIREAEAYDSIRELFSDHGRLFSRDLIPCINDRSWIIHFGMSRNWRSVELYSCEIVKDKDEGDVYVIKFDLVDENI